MCFVNSPRRGCGRLQGHVRQAGDPGALNLRRDPGVGARPQQRARLQAGVHPRHRHRGRQGQDQGDQAVPPVQVVPIAKVRGRQARVRGRGAAAEAMRGGRRRRHERRQRARRPERRTHRRAGRQRLRPGPLRPDGRKEQILRRADAEAAGEPRGRPRG